MIAVRRARHGGWSSRHVIAGRSGRFHPTMSAHPSHGSIPEHARLGDPGVERLARAIRVIIAVLVIVLLLRLEILPPSWLS